MMRRFEDLDILDQVELLAKALEVIAAGPGRSFEDLAQADDVTVIDVWRRVCAETGFDECTPWEGFPGQPTNLPRETSYVS